MIDFRTHPSRYNHWRLDIDGPVASLFLDVEESAGLESGYELKLNSYDLGVDIELYDAVQRLRFEHPEVNTVLLRSAHDRVFSAGANIRMLAQASHADKVNFCKFTNETRLSIEDATDRSGQLYIAVIEGSCAGGGYELALAADRIIMLDDGSTSVSLPELPLLAVLPGTGGLTRLVDKRHVRRDRADVFCTLEEGIRGERAAEWGLVDEVVPASRLAERLAEISSMAEKGSRRASEDDGVVLSDLAREVTENRLEYKSLSVQIDRSLGVAGFNLRGPAADVPESVSATQESGTGFWPLALARELDDAILHLRFNEPEIGTWTFRSDGDPDRVSAADAFLANHADSWFVQETTGYLKRVLKRLDVSARSLVSLVEPGSCFVGTLLELCLASDRTYMLEGTFEGDNRPPAIIRLTDMNFGAYPMGNGCNRLESRFIESPENVEEHRQAVGKDLDADAAEALGLVTFTPDDIDWEDEIRIAIEERASFSPDALTAMEANLRFAGPETLETKIFARLSAWQNWIFQRPNATGEVGALKRYGSGQRPSFDKTRA